jgi:chromosome partitioning protein
VFSVAIVSMKGGVGKTALACTLAVHAELSGGRAAVLDCDPQATAFGWAEKRAKLGKTSPMVGAVVDAERIAQAQADASADGFDWLFVDTPPGVSELASTAVALADLVLVPCVPQLLVMDAMGPTVRLVRRVGVPAFFVVNRGRSKAINDAAAVALSSGYGLPVAGAHISTRLPIADAADQGLTLAELTSNTSSVISGREEIAALWRWLQQQRKGVQHDEGTAVRRGELSATQVGPRARRARGAAAG